MSDTQLQATDPKGQVPQEQLVALQTAQRGKQQTEPGAETPGPLPSPVGVQTKSEAGKFWYKKPRWIVVTAVILLVILGSIVVAKNMSKGGNSPSSRTGAGLTSNGGNFSAVTGSGVGSNVHICNGDDWGDVHHTCLRDTQDLSLQDTNLGHLMITGINGANFSSTDITVKLDWGLGTPSNYLENDQHLQASLGENEVSVGLRAYLESAFQVPGTDGDLSRIYSTISQGSHYIIRVSAYERGTEIGSTTFNLGEPSTPDAAPTPNNSSVGCGTPDPNTGLDNVSCAL